MKNRLRKSLLLLSSLLTLSAGLLVVAWPLWPALATTELRPALPVSGGPALPIQPGPEKPQVEVVFVLDSTSSMSGLIDAAKQNIWSIATTLASAQPEPEFRLGLVTFRDKGDRYITRVKDLTQDIDQLYLSLMETRAEGGGDMPEHVNQALYDAVHNVSWSQNPEAYQVIFLVGDAPAHMDYDDDVPFTETLKVAQSKGIVVNAIQAGQQSVTREQFQQIAALSQGEFFQVSQSGDSVAIHTPYDTSIAELSAQLDQARLYYGDAEKKARQKEKIAASDKLSEEASVVARVRRALYNATTAGGSNYANEQELLEDLERGKVALADVPEAELPEPFQALSPAQRADKVAELSAKRQSLKAELESLSRQRSDFIREQLEDASADLSLEAKIFAALKSQSGEKGLHLDTLVY